MTISFDTPPADVIDYFKAKKPELHFNYDEILHEAHNKAFTVAKVTKLDLLSDIHESLLNAQKSGQSFESWKKDLIPTLQKYGWWGKTEVMNPATGEFKTIEVGSRRLKTIFDTNMRTSYATSHYNSLMNSNIEYLRYSAILDNRTRPSHRSMHGTILPKDDPWWDINFPPNGWRCRCSVSGYTGSQLDGRGMKVSKRPSNIADRDWAYNPGKNKFFDTKYNYPCIEEGLNAKKPCSNKETYETKGLPKLQELPKELIKISPKILTAGKDRLEGLEIITSAILGKEKSRIVQTPLEKIIITKELLHHAVEKEAREVYANFMVATLEDPLEIWFTRFDDGKIRPQYIAMFDHPAALLVSVVLGRDGSLMWNFMKSDIHKMNKKRIGEWMWKKY